MNSGEKSTELIESIEVYNDFVFKHMFGVEGQKDKLLSLLNAILKGRPAIESLEFMNSEISRENRMGKSIRLDILAKTQDNTTVTIEIQCNDEGNIIDRTSFYQAKLMVADLRRGKDYNCLSDIITIWIVNYPATRRKHYSHSIVKMFEPDGFDPAEVASDKFRTIIIELPKIKLDDTIIERTDDMFYLWTAFIKDPGSIPESVSNRVKIIGEAMTELKKLKNDDNFIEEYWLHQKAIDDYNSAMSLAIRRGREEGMEKGREEGITVGMEKGIEKGMEKGKIETALAMLKESMPVGVIAKCTGLSPEEITRLTQKLD
jgi:predicted transposase/invertase (TIGR01784 family)